MNEELLFGLDSNGTQLHTTTYWYYRACRAAASGAGGHLSGPFTGLTRTDQEHAIATMLLLPDGIGLPDHRHVVPVMVDVATRQSRLNRLNLEAVAAAHVLRATV
ncbi:MAG: hypothetical protein ACRDU0_12285 [Mycobacterium sp.]